MFKEKVGGKMKKFLIIVSMMFCLLPVTSQEIPSKVKNQLEKSGLYCFGEDADGNQSKPVIKFLVQSKEDFTKKTVHYQVRL